MFDYSLADRTVELIVERFSPKKIIIFGSVAKREASETSDLDLLVVMESDRPDHERAVPIYVAVAGIRVPKDILVMTPEEFDRSRIDPTSFTSKIVRTGVVAYEA